MLENFLQILYEKNYTACNYMCNESFIKCCTQKKYIYIQYKWCYGCVV